MLRQLKAEDCVAYAPVKKCPGNLTQYRAIPSCSISRVLHWLQHVLETAKVLEIAKYEVFLFRVACRMHVVVCRKSVAQH